ncbi:MAG: sugar ABC transporter permease [Cephaloticoccus sp.]|nr:sugar ABC transporter permease [Cephaloticoccus sp.]
MKLSGESRRTTVGFAFLLPNIIGFLVFTLVPLVVSFAMAFTDWDIQRHNLFRDDPLRFVWWENFGRLFTHPDFYRYLGNTLFLMMGLPVSIAGSLGAALLLTRAGQGRAARRKAGVLAGGVLVASAGVLLLGGFDQHGIWLMFGLLACTVLVGGVLSGGLLYRTLFYLPHFTAGVATYVLWKKLYNPHSGPINRGLAPVLEGLTGAVQRHELLFARLLPLLLVALILIILAWQTQRLRRRLVDGDIGLLGWALGGLATAIPIGLTWQWNQGAADMTVTVATATGGLILLLAWARPAVVRGSGVKGDAGLGTELILGLGLVALLTALGGLAAVARVLPEMAQGGLKPPNWLGTYEWAKPAIMIMALWAAIGSNNMILYMAGLSNIPTELYEAADMDGASSWQRFCHITWPQLAPITFFIGVMSVIHGLQGGFEMARTMTAGGPAGSTTTMSYFIYLEGFETGRLGYASAVAWVLFVLVCGLSFFNVKFGNRYVND